MWHAASDREAGCVYRIADSALLWVKFVVVESKHDAARMLGGAMERRALCKRSVLVKSFQCRSP